MTGQELLSLTGVSTGQIARAFVGDAGLQFTTDKLVASAGPEWDASGLPMSTEAQELADWLTAPDKNSRFQTLDELAARLKSDATIGDEARSLALQLVRQRRSPTIPYKQISVVLSRSDAPREQYERALAMIREANDQTAIDLRHLLLGSPGSVSPGRFCRSRGDSDTCDARCRSSEMLSSGRRFNHFGNGATAVGPDRSGAPDTRSCAGTGERGRIALATTRQRSRKAARDTPGRCGAESLDWPQVHASYQITRRRRDGTNNLRLFSSNHDHPRRGKSAVVWKIYDRPIRSDFAGRCGCLLRQCV